MSESADQRYLRSDQYRDASKLNARVQLHERFSTNKYGWHIWVFDHFDLPPEAVILELGCGPGHLWLKNIDRIPDGWDIILSDFSKGMLQQARENLGTTGRPFKFRIIDAQSIHLPSQSFDAVIANHMLFHVPDRQKALSEIHRILRPGGRLYAATNGQHHLSGLFDLVRKYDPDVYEKQAHSGVRTYNGFSLENGLNQLSPLFSKITLDRYPDALVITETEPLVAWVKSLATVNLDEEIINDFVNFLNREMNLHKSIHVTKDSGIFEALK